MYLKCKKSKSVSELINKNTIYFVLKNQVNSCWLEFFSEINKRVVLNNAMLAGKKLSNKYPCSHGY